MMTKYSTLEAVLAWQLIPAAVRSRILLEVPCKNCKRCAPMCESYGKFQKGKLILRGKCGFCFRAMKLIIEFPETMECDN